MTKIDPRVLDQLLGTMQEETSWIHRLHRLAHRQRAYLVKRDERRVRWVSDQIEESLPRARELAQKRELEVRAALGGTSSSLKLLIQKADNRQREKVEKAVSDLAAAGDRLHRRNVQNYQLATFALDLTQEEMRLLVGAEHDDGAYAADGQRRSEELSGVLDGRA